MLSWELSFYARTLTTNNSYKWWAVLFPTFSSATNPTGITEFTVRDA